MWLGANARSRACKTQHFAKGQPQLSNAVWDVLKRQQQKHTNASQAQQQPIPRRRDDVDPISQHTLSFFSDEHQDAPWAQSAQTDIVRRLTTHSFRAHWNGKCWTQSTKEHLRDTQTPPQRLRSMYYMCDTDDDWWPLGQRRAWQPCSPCKHVSLQYWCHKPLSHMCTAKQKKTTKYTSKHLHFLRPRSLFSRVVAVCVCVCLHRPGEISIFTPQKNDLRDTASSMASMEQMLTRLNSTQKSIHTFAARARPFCVGVVQRTCKSKRKVFVMVK